MRKMITVMYAINLGLNLAFLFATYANGQPNLAFLAAMAGWSCALVESLRQT